MSEDVPMNQRKCKVDGCENNARALDLCVKHYFRFKKYGDVNKTAWSEKRKCSIENCDNLHEGFGYCRIHYLRYKKYGTPTPDVNFPELHKMSHSKEYRVWAKIKDRCENSNNPAYKNYGGRGIKIYEEWSKSFLAFYGYMGNRPFEKAEIDRIDNDGNYEPGNCRWVNRYANSHNKSTSKLTVQSVQEIRNMYKTGEYTQRFIAKKYRVSQSTIYKIVNRKIWNKKERVLLVGNAANT